MFMDALYRLPVRNSKGRTQSRVPINQLLERPLQRRHIKFSSNPYGAYQITHGVVRGRLEQRPQSSLAVRNRVFLEAAPLHGWDEGGVVADPGLNVVVEGGCLDSRRP